MNFYSRISVLMLLAVFGLNTGCFSTKRSAIEENSPNQPAARREFRAAWVATVDNIDWPSKKGLTTAEQQAEILAILDTAAALKLNAIVFQARPQCDAFYKSDLEPWSYFLTGKQGEAPEPYYDPLQFWITEAHKRGLELHAWFNPYRAHHPQGGELSSHSIVKQKPELARELNDGYYWLEPADPRTREHSLAVILDVVRRYDVDGVHLDDYFYPYPDYHNGRDFPDDANWQKYQQGGGKLSRGDWRRDQVNCFVEELYRRVKNEKKFVKVGISPFGIWRPGYPDGVEGFDQYNQLYADARLWLNQGWIDYFTPQIYWRIDQFQRSFPVILSWWHRENQQKRHLWPGLAIFNMRDSSGVQENINQIMVTRGIEAESAGEILFSMKQLLQNRFGITSALQAGPYRDDALVPPSPWLDQQAPAMPVVSLNRLEDKLKIRWSPASDNSVFRWVIYYHYNHTWRYEILNGGMREYTLEAQYPLARRQRNNGLEADSSSIEMRPVTQIAVSAVSRTGVESPRRILYPARNE